MKKMINIKRYFLLFTGFILNFYLNIQYTFGQTLDDIFGEKKPKHLVELSSKNEVEGKDLVLSIVAKFVDIILYFSGTIAIGFLIYGGLRLITDFGTDSGKDEAKKIVTNALLGLLVIFIAVILVENTQRFIKYIFGNGAL